jgi:hypothetical protein
MSYPKKRVNLLFKNREQVDTDSSLYLLDIIEMMWHNTFGRFP